jgi:nucleotide-binding universal stress UspA family protein
MFKKILVPLDGSELAARILPQVVDMAKCFQAEVTLLHVCNTPIWAELAGAPIAMETEAEKKEMKWCATYLGEAAKQLQDQGLKVNTECVEGTPAREIIAYADTRKFDVIAMATHGKGEVAWVLGSTAERVVSHATVPVLLFRVVEMKPPLLKEEWFETPGVQVP